MKFFLLLTAFLYSCSASQASSSSDITLEATNTITLSDEFNDLTVANVLDQAYKIDRKLPAGLPIYLVLNTPGGSITAGMELIQNLKAIKRPVHTITLFAASMGFQTVQGLGTRYVVKYGELMSHRAYGGFQAEFGGSEPSELTNRYNSWLTKLEELDKVTVSRTKGKQTLESYRAAYASELWISGSKAVEAGYADAVIEPKCGKTLNNYETKIVYYMGTEVRLKMSKCPLITGPLDFEMFIPTRKGLMSYKQFMQQGGTFGAACAVNTNILCPKDITLTESTIEQIKKQVMSNKKTSKGYVL